MIDKEVAELRRRYRQDRSNITKKSMAGQSMSTASSSPPSPFPWACFRRVSRKNIWSC